MCLVVLQLLLRSGKKKKRTYMNHRVLHDVVKCSKDSNDVLEDETFWKISQVNFMIKGATGVLTILHDSGIIETVLQGTYVNILRG